MKLNPRRKDVDFSGGRTAFADKSLRMARALNGRHEPSSAELKLARHLAQQGASWAQIHAALGWQCKRKTIYQRLKKFNIFVRVGNNATDKPSKFGGLTGMRNAHQPSDALPYRPARRGARA